MRWCAVFARYTIHLYSPAAHSVSDRPMKILRRVKDRSKRKDVFPPLALLPSLSPPGWLVDQAQFFFSKVLSPPNFAFSRVCVCVTMLATLTLLLLEISGMTGTRINITSTIRDIIACLGKTGFPTDGSLTVVVYCYCCCCYYDYYS